MTRATPAMRRYANRDGDSGVVAYALAPGQITVRFRDGATYLYDTARPGAAAIAQMQQLAVEGRGLGSYISRHVREQYARKLD